MPGRVYEATASRFFAAIYDKLMAGTEEAGLADRRRRLLENARGATLELGAGTGGNLEYYPDAVTELVLTEPSEHMAKRLRAKVSAGGREAQVILAPAERLPFEDDHFDTVVGTLMLCTADDPVAVLGEVRRVLRPGGQLLFLEHVRSDQPKVARWQDRLEKPWGFIGAGCHPNRDTRATIAASGLQLEDVEDGELPKAPPIVRPLISGRATRPQA
jgi:ubiquinone/menaquinone biosynthesis C-methylase UbiE